MTGSSHNQQHHDDVEDLIYSSRDVGLAFFVTIMAGLATLVGAAAAIFVVRLYPQQEQQQQEEHNRLFLSRGLALAAGAIIYIAFVDLLVEGTEFFVVDARTNDQERLATVWSTLGLFGGAAAMAFWSYMTHKLIGHHYEVNDHKQEEEQAEEQEEEPKTKHTEETIGDVAVEEGHETPISNYKQGSSNDNSHVGIKKKQSSLCQSGISTTLALIMHSLPEGLVTFLATVQDPSIGAALAIGIALHNGVEGMSIALPIYFASTGGQKCKALAASGLAGLAPVLGGLIGYIILKTTADQDIGNTAFGIMFTMAAGMLIYIAINELLQMAYKHDPNDKVTTLGFFGGMALIALALVILESTGNHDHASSGHDDGHGVEASQLHMPWEDSINNEHHPDKQDNPNEAWDGSGHHHDQNNDHHHW